MADYKVTDTELTSIANAIRTKGGTQEQLEFPDGFVSAVQAIPTGGGGTNRITIYDYDSMKAAYNFSNKSVVGSYIYNQESNGSTPTTNTSFDQPDMVCVATREGYRNGGLTFLQKIPSTMTKMHVRMRTVNASTYKIVNFELGRNIDINSMGHNPSAIKTIFSVNANTNYTSYDVDISDITEDTYLTIHNCDITYQIDELYFE